jgi:N-acetylneuraminic acid mutarotase
MMRRIAKSVLGASLALCGAFYVSPASSQTVPAAPGVWSTAAPLPLAHSEVAVAAVNGIIYVEGGSVAGRMAIEFNEAYDPVSRQWRERAPLPRPLTHLGVTGMNGKLYVVGGFSDPLKDHVGAVDTAYEYNPASNSWRSLAHMKSPRGSVGVAALNGKIYAVGGRGLDLVTVDTTEVYDPLTNQWTELNALPRARDHLAVVAAEGKIHAIGGRFGSSRDNTGMHDIYDPATNTWQPGLPLPTPRSSVAATLYQGLIVVDGGECNAGVTFDQNEAYDVKASRWTTLATMPAGRHGFGAAAIGDAIYFAGGALGCGGGGLTNELLAFRLAK